MTRLTERLALEQEDIQAMTGTTEERIARQEREFNQKRKEIRAAALLQMAHNQLQDRRDDMICKVCGSVLSAVTFTCVREKYHDRRDDITKPDSTYSFPARTLTW